MFSQKFFSYVLQVAYKCIFIFHINSVRNESVFTHVTSEYKFIGTKESVYIRKEFDSHGIGLEHQNGRRFIVVERPTLNSIRQTDVDTLMICTQSRVRVRVRVWVRVRVRVWVRVRVRAIYLNQTGVRHQILGGVGVRVMHCRSEAPSSNPTHSILNCFFP